LRLISLGAVVAVVLAFAAHAFAEPAEDPQLRNAAGVSVLCWSEREWWTDAYRIVGVQPSRVILDGFWGYRGAVSLAPWNCAALRRLVTEHWQPRAFVAKSTLGGAIFTLAHELAHARGVRDEHAADRSAARTMFSLARRLGAGRAYARALTDFYLAG